MSVECAGLSITRTDIVRMALHEFLAAHKRGARGSKK